MQLSQLLHHRLLRRPTRFLSALLCSFAVLFLLADLAFQSTTIYAQQLPVRHWAIFREPDGLISNNVLVALADHGAVWFGTDQGVSRFDGAWRTFPTGPAGEAGANLGTAVPPGAATALLRSADGQHIWLGTSLGHLARWDGYAWTNIANLNSAIHHLEQDSSGLWIATDNGLELYHNNTTHTVPALTDHPVYDLLSMDDGLWAATGAGLWRVSPTLDATQLPLESKDIAGGQLTGQPIFALWKDKDTVWLGMAGAVARYQLATGQTHVYQPFTAEQAQTRVTAIQGIAGESVWIASNGGGVVQYRMADGTPVGALSLGSGLEGGLDTNVVNAMVIDGDGSIWFTTPVGVYRFQPWAWQDVDDGTEGLPVNDLLLDETGNLWIATAGEGVREQHNPYVQPTIFSPDNGGLPSGYVYDLEQDPFGNLWAGTANGLAVFSGKTWTIPAAVAGASDQAVKFIQADEHGLWLGTATGLLRYTFENQLLTPEARFAGHAVSALHHDAEGDLWLGLEEGGIWRRSTDGSWQEVLDTTTRKPPRGAATAFLPDPTAPAGMLAAIQNQGIYRWHNGVWEEVTGKRWLNGARVFSLALEPADNSIWVGSEISLSRFDSNGWVTYDTQDGVQNGAIHAILRDALGNYWFGSQKGLSYYQPKHSRPWVRLDGISAAELRAGSEETTAFTEHPVAFHIQMGDPQMTPGKLQIFYRQTFDSSSSPWKAIVGNPVILDFTRPGHYQIDFIARDQAFNYSLPVTQRLSIEPAPSVVALPLLGEVQSTILQLLIVFGGLALLGFAYVSFEVVQQRLRVTEAVRRRFNPYISGEPVRREDMFFGRQDLLQRIASTLHNNSIMIHGERRIGKTTLLYQLASALRQMKDSEYWFVPVFVDLEGTDEQRLFHLLMEEIATAVLTLPELTAADKAAVSDLLVHQTEASSYTDRDFSRDLRSVIRELEQLSAAYYGGRHVRLILLIDEMDTLSSFDHLYQQQLRRIFMRDFATNLGAVVAGIAISKDWDRIESPWYNLFNEIEMEPFTDVQAVELLVEPVRGYYVYDDVVVDFILANCAGRPYRIQQYALEAVNAMLRDRRRRITMADALVAHEHIQAALASDGTAGKLAQQKSAYGEELDAQSTVSAAQVTAPLD